MQELSLIDKAKDVAQQAHMGQTRRVSKQPYIIHPFRVFQTLVSMGFNKDIQLVGLLHDVYEDAKNKKYTEDVIKSKFGNTIWIFVKLLSHDNTVDYNSYVLTLAKRSETALIVKLVDMYENLLDSPSEKQKNKYINAIKYLLKNKIIINTNILNKFKSIGMIEKNI